MKKMQDWFSGTIAQIFISSVILFEIKVFRFGSIGKQPMLD